LQVQKQNAVYYLIARGGTLVLVVPSVLAERKDDIKRIVTLFGNPFLRLNGEIGLSVYGNVTSYLAEGDIQVSLLWTFVCSIVI
jgi:hypothetical protein